MKLLPESIGRTVARNVLLVQKGSPGVLLSLGIVGMVASTVLACRATLKMEEVMEEAKFKLDRDENRGRDISLIYTQTSIRIVRLYAPAVIVGGISIASLTRSHTLLTQRNAALTAAYSALEKGFSEYRSRVVEKYGEEEDQHFRYGSEEIEIEDSKTGKKKTVKRVGTDVPSIYARFFDPLSSSWNREPEYNLIFLQCQQNYANDLLISRGHLFLNEVYDMLGIPRSKAGAVVGWVFSKNGNTDNFVNFGVFDGKTEVARDFVNGREGAILLDFNVDGVIYDKIDNKGDDLSWQLGR